MIRTNYDSSPCHGSALADSLDLKTEQVVDIRGPRTGRLMLTSLALVTRALSALSAGATVKVEEFDPNRLVPAVAATLTTALTGANNDLLLTAKLAGLAGNDITLALVNPATPSAALGVVVTTSAIVVNLATSAGTAQVETATVTAAAGATSDGNLAVTVTGAGIAGSPLVVQVPLTLLTHTTAALVADAIRTALGATAAITALYTVGGTGADVSLTKTVAAANDATLNIALAGSLGVTAAPTSANTTAGVVPAITSTAAQVKAAIDGSTPAAALVTVANAGGNDGTGVVTALAATALAGGAAAYSGVVVQTLVEAADLPDTDAIGRVHALTLAADVGVVGPDTFIRFTISAGSTATTHTADLALAGLIL